ncbi:MAG: hypothetical protein D6706_13885 [Chloroflexi bacterium]|nr:MAG: hypothetical protein D6706_13885 [Chloroflexota bacterium]
MNISQTGGHIDHLLRQTRVHHVQLSSMADVKANMMITLSSLVITFSVRYLSDPYLRWPVIIMLLFCFFTILAAAYAVMPKLDYRYRPNLKNPDCNVLFFGSFMNLTYPEFAGILEEVINDPARTYEAQVREVYELGVFLGYKKYRYIRLAYLLFLTGLFVSGLVLIVVEFFNFSHVLAG